MPRIGYISKSFRKDTLKIIAAANAIIEEYMAAGYRLTLRQLYYQFVARDMIPNRQSEYKRLGGILTDARNAGLVDWNAIEDRTRNLRSLAHWDSPREIVEVCASQFRYDLWEKQEHRPEVWVEKDALVGVFSPVCQELDVPILSCRGYTSASELWESGQRLRRHCSDDQIPVILHFGDHDPSGVDMTRDIQDRLTLYSGYPVQVDRLALNMDQVEEYNPPPNVAKQTDTRYAKYVEVYGETCWELDALEPQVIGDLIREAVGSYRDDAVWAEEEKRQEQARKKLRKVAREWKD